MALEIRFEPKCYYSTPEHSASLWGKYVYIYKGQGSLRLTDDALELDSPSLRQTIPLKSIKSIGMGLFSKAAKPFGLAYIKLSYVQDEWVDTIYLVPARSAWAPTWETSQLVASWIETLGQVEGLFGRIERPLPAVPVPPSPARFAFFLLVLCMPVMIGLSVLVCGFWVARWR